MGAIAIWCMHFIGNRAIVLANGQVVLQIAYNAGFTSLSFFVPILVLLAAFLAVGSNDKISTVRLTLGGTLTGQAICGMHYLGQAGISNYTCIYSPAKVVGSALIAIIASVAALWVFFVLRSTWTNSWWKRALTATVLAGGVSGMHWLASIGTQYQLKHVNPSHLQDLSNDSTIIVVIVLSITACFILLGFTLVAQRRRSQYVNRARQVVLAAIVFDKDGRLMVTPEGLLPSQKITNSYLEKSFDDVFGTSHPSFLWMFRTTRNWSAITSLLPAMRSHLNLLSAMNGWKSGLKAAELALTNDDGAPIADYSIIFRELFCVAAAELAEQLNDSIENVGVLYDEILNAGQTLRKKLKARNSTFQSASNIELGGLELPLFGRGQLLFLVRNASRRQVERLQATGYRFANIQNVVDIIAHSLQVSVEDITRRLIDMRRYATESQILEPGVHMAYFAMRATVRGNFDVLVRKDAKCQLPTMQMPLKSLENWQIDYLSSMDGWSVTQCLRHLVLTPTNGSLSKSEHTFLAQLCETLEALKNEINDPLFADARLISRPVLAPCRGSREGSRPFRAQLIAFRLMVPIYFKAPGQKLEFTPLAFFKVQQHVYKHSPEHAVFARKIHREFGPVFNQVRHSIVAGGDDKSPISLTLPGGRFKKGSLSTIDLETSSDSELRSVVSMTPLPEPRSRFKIWQWGKRKGNIAHDRAASSNTDASDAGSEKVLFEPNFFGGILVSQEVSVDVKDAERSSEADLSSQSRLEGDVEIDDLTRNMSDTKDNSKEVPSMKMGTTGTASTEMEDSETYVDKLFAACVETR
ncbi:MAG: hypothetical protein M1818_006705 [Claussenomyces sp. TS43310]|nr:MAG: hypothetical protein M1818_006705 [Claussenomyces sp. TS43310]